MKREEVAALSLTLHEDDQVVLWRHLDDAGSMTFFGDPNGLSKNMNMGMAKPELFELVRSRIPEEFFSRFGAYEREEGGGPTLQVQIGFRSVSGEEAGLSYRYRATGAAPPLEVIDFIYHVLRVTYMWWESQPGFQQQPDLFRGAPFVRARAEPRVREIRDPPAAHPPATTLRAGWRDRLDRLGLRRTKDDVVIGAQRLLVGLTLVTASATKLAVPLFIHAWEVRVDEAALPAWMGARWTIPLLELAVGALLVIGVYTRLAAMLACALFALSAHVQATLGRPELFPLQPADPALPVVMLLLALALVVLGGGAWSADLRRG